MPRRPSPGRLSPRLPSQKLPRWRPPHGRPRAPAALGTPGAGHQRTHRRWANVIGGVETGAAARGTGRATPLLRRLPPIPRAWGGPSAPAPAAPGPACTPRAPGVPLCIPAASPSRPTAAGRFLGARHGRPGTDVASRDAWRAAENSHCFPGTRHTSGKGGRGRHPNFLRLRVGGAFPITRATTAR